MAEKTESEDRHGSVRLAAPWYATTLPRWRSHQLPTPAWECVKIKSGCSLCSKRVFLSLIGMNVPSTPPRDHTHNIISKIVNYMLKHVRDGGTYVWFSSPALLCQFWRRFTHKFTHGVYTYLGFSPGPSRGLNKFGAPFLFLSLRRKDPEQHRPPCSSM